MTPPTPSFHGVATVNDKGQVVIPAEARRAIDLEAGEKLLVYSVGEGTVMMCKVSQMEKLAGDLAQRLDLMRTAIQSAGE